MCVLSDLEFILSEIWAEGVDFIELLHFASVYRKCASLLSPDLGIYRGEPSESLLKKRFDAETARPPNSQRSSSLWCKCLT